jgi:chitinase
MIVRSHLKVYLVLGVLLLFCLVQCLTLQSYERSGEKRLSKVVMGYYAGWKKVEFDHTKINFKNLTHLAHAFTKPDSKGNLIVADDYLYLELNVLAHKNKVKVIMSIGGWGNCEGFPGMVSKPQTRQKFINQVLKFCKKNSYDGVDIDWEFVSNAEEQQNFVLFIKELSAALKAQSPPLLLTMAAPAGDYYAKWIKFEELISDFDFISVMTYDYHGPWSDHSGHNSPLYTTFNDPCGSVNDSYVYAHFLRKIPNNKLLLGVPFYGRSFDCARLYQKFQKSNDYGYSEIRNFMSSGWDYIWDEGAKVPYIRKKDMSEIISFDDERSVAQKCRYIKQRKVAGLIVWEISLDYYQGSSVLLDVIGKEFRKK